MYSTVYHRCAIYRVQIWDVQHTCACARSNCELSEESPAQSVPLVMYRHAFATSPLQFGFKPGLSTELCTELIKNVTARYCFNDYPVYGCFLDASKAFDRVDHHLLFKKLFQRDLPPVVVRALLTWYSEQEVSVLWNQSSSDKFSISNGVRQGGVLSPILFTVYMDDLLLELERAGVGCFWRHHYVGAVCYADDLALLAPSLSALRIA